MKHLGPLRTTNIFRSAHAPLAGLLAGTLLLFRVSAQTATPVYSWDDCLSLALKQNPDIAASSKRVDAAKAAITTAKGAIYPALTTSAFYQKREQQVATNGNQFPENRPDDYIADARLTQNVYSAGAVRARIAIAKIRAEGEMLNSKATTNSVALQVQLAFLQTLFARENIRIQEQSVDLVRAELIDQLKLLKAGAVAQVNVDRAQVALGNQEPVLEQARANLQTAYVQLSQLLAIPYSERALALPFTIRGELRSQPENLLLLDCLRRADEHRPEIASRRLTMAAAQRQITVEKSTTRPQINLFAAYDIYSETDVRAVRDNFSGYTIGVSAGWTIFDGFATRGRVNAAQAQVKISETGLVAIHQQVQAEVRSAFYALQQAKATLPSQAENVKLATEAMELTNKNMNAGIATLLDVLQARVDLTRAQSLELAGRLEFNTALARLRSALGEIDLPEQAAGK